MNPKKLGGKANHRQEPWKVPLPQYIEELYLKRFRKERPDNVRSIEQMMVDRERKQAECRERRRLQQETMPPDNLTPPLALPRLEELTGDGIPF